MDLTQVILVSAVFVLTIIISLVGIEVFFVFREMRRSFKKTNKVLEDVELVSGVVSKQVNNVSNVLDVVRVSADLMKKFLGSDGEKVEKKKETAELPVAIKKEEEGNGTHKVSSFRHFFTRSGRKLS